MAFAREGFQAFTQEYIARTINTSLFKKVPLLYVLAGIGGNQTLSNMRLGRPGVSDVFSGKKISKTQRESYSGFNSYDPVIHFRKNDSTKAMGSRDTMPTVSSATTTSQDQNYATARFMWAAKATPILVWNETLDRAVTSAGTGLNNQGKAVANVLTNCLDEAMNVHIDAWASSFWTGSPTNQTADLWDDCAGLTGALSASNIYGNVDRSATANAQWRAQVVSAARTMSIANLIDEANLTQNCGIVGNGIDLVLTTPALYRTAKEEVRAKGTGMVLSDGLPDAGEFGFKKEVLRYDNTYIMYDPLCPDNTVACLNLETWKVITHPKKNFTATSFTNLKEYAEGAKDAMQAFIETKLIVACENPNVNCIFTSVS